jgi:hypothetical protein
MLRKRISEEKSLIEIQGIKGTVESELMQRSGVTGVDIGYKYVNGKKTNKIGIRVFVEKKKDVPRDEMIPQAIEGVKTDVIELEFIPQPLSIPVEGMSPQEDTGNYNSLKGGISIGPCRLIDGHIHAGTLGIIVKDNATGNPMLLSNFHVMCVDNEWNVGDAISQPSRLDNGNCPDDVVGTLSRASLGGQVDCAVAFLTARDQVFEVVDIGAINGTASAALDMNVRKRGRTTGLTYGTVEGLSGSIRLNYGNGIGEVILKNQITVKADPAHSTLFSDNGDSGSVVVNDSGAIVGLLCAGGFNVQLGFVASSINPIEAVLSVLEVSISSRSVEERLAAIESTLSHLLATENRNGN